MACLPRAGVYNDRHAQSTCKPVSQFHESHHQIETSTAEGVGLHYLQVGEPITAEDQAGLVVCEAEDVTLGLAGLQGQ